LKRYAATPLRRFVHTMFTHDVRPEALLFNRSAFARARVKSACICRLIERPDVPSTNENRIDT
jgi:hypothetical protein